MEILLIVLIMVLALIFITMMKSNHSKARLERIRLKIFNKQNPVTFTKAKEMFNKYLLKNYDPNIVDFYNSQFIPITCTDIPDYGISTLLDQDITDVELERLKQCGYLYNFAFLTSILYNVNENVQNFKDLIVKTVDNIKDFKPLPPAPVSSVGLSIPPNVARNLIF
jgi:hypothetical protein